MKPDRLALHARNLPSLKEDYTKHMLRLTNDSAWAGVVLRLDGELQEIRYAFCRHDLKKSTLHGAVMDQAMNGRLANADRKFASLESVSANRFSPLRLHFSISVRPHALTNRMTASAITAPLRADRGRSA